MPVNEINAASYAIVSYHTTHNHPHVFRLYFDAVPTADGDGVFSFPTYTDGAHLSGWTLAEIITELLDRAALATTQMPAVDIDQVAVWDANVGVNTFLGLDASDYSAATGGTATSIAAAYYMIVAKAATLQQFRLMWMDAGDAKPQRTAVGTPPSTDDGGINWFLCRSAVGFTTVDGVALSFVASVNTGYNRKLARSYGRTVTP